MNAVEGGQAIIICVPIGYTLGVLDIYDSKLNNVAGPQLDALAVVPPGNDTGVRMTGGIGGGAIVVGAIVVGAIVVVGAGSGQSIEQIILPYF